MTKVYTVVVGWMEETIPTALSPTWIPEDITCIAEPVTVKLKVEASSEEEAVLIALDRIGLSWDDVAIVEVNGRNMKRVDN